MKEEHLNDRRNKNIVQYDIYSDIFHQLLKKS